MRFGNENYFFFLKTMTIDTVIVTENLKKSFLKDSKD